MASFLPWTVKHESLTRQVDAFKTDLIQMTGVNMLLAENRNSGIAAMAVQMKENSSREVGVENLEVFGLLSITPRSTTEMKPPSVSIQNRVWSLVNKFNE